MEDNVQLQQLLSKYGQEHLLTALNKITDKKLRTSFSEKLNKIDFQLINKLYSNYQTQILNEKNETYENITEIKSTFNKNDISQEEEQTLSEIGYSAISRGKVALLILAGGQGSRLGYNKAKGMYNVGMPSNKSLFQYLVERFIAAQRYSLERSKETNSKQGTLFIMTSIENDEETREFFKSNKYFGMSSENVVFFPQDTIPAINIDGKIINKSLSEIFENPNGNGGCFIAMKKHQIVEELAQREIDYIHVISVDNPLTKVLDPVFVGLNIKKNSEISAKFIGKREAHEPVGVFVNLNGKATMIDYCIFPKQLTEERNSNGKLRFNTSNILNYFINVKYLSQILGNESKYNELIYQFNYARKKIDSFNVETEKEGKVEGIKFELFFNSIFTFAETEMVLLETDRNEEFAPIKNADPAPNDTPTTSRKIMSNLFKKWLGNKEIKESENLLEISFIKSYSGENLSEFSSKSLTLPAYID